MTPSDTCINTTAQTKYIIIKIIVVKTRVFQGQHLTLSSLIAGIKPGAAASGATGPTSQIPGLSQTADETAPAERTSGRRVGIFATDSDYVKLAKQGGHKGMSYLLLLYFERALCKSW